MTPPDGSAEIADARSTGFAVRVESDVVSSSEATRFLQTAVITACVSLLGVASINLLVDPTGIFGTGLLQPVVWTMRAQKVKLLASQDQPLTALILGSSRAMKIRPEFIDRSFDVFAFNGAVNSAMVEDLVAMYRYASKDLRHPVGTVVLALDVESFHNTNEPDRRLVATEELARQLPGIRDFDWAVNRAVSTISFAQLRLSTASIRFALSEYPEAKTSIDRRGFLSYLRWEKEVTQGDFDFQAQIARSLPEYEARYREFSALSEERKAKFLTFIDDLKRNQVDVYVYLTPLHPELIEHLERNSEFKIRADELSLWLTQELDDMRVPFLDATHLQTIGVDPGAFFDGAHPMEETNEKILGILFRRTVEHAVQ